MTEKIPYNSLFLWNYLTKKKDPDAFEPELPEF